MKIIFLTLTALIATVSAQLTAGAVPDGRGGHTGTLSLGHQFGNPQQNYGGSASVSQNSRGGQPTYSAGVNYNNNGHGVSFDHSRTPGQGHTNTLRGTANVFDNGNHRVNVNAYGSQTRWKRQLKGFETYGTSIDYSNSRGHGGSIGYQKTPLLKQEQINANANVKLFQNKQTSLDAYGGASRDIGRSNHGKTDYNAGVKFVHRF